MEGAAVGAWVCGWVCELTCAPRGCSHRPRARVAQDSWDPRALAMEIGNRGQMGVVGGGREVPAHPERTQAWKSPGRLL